MALDGRIKRLFSIREKLRRQKIGLDEVYDLIALRVITPSVRDCYAALGIIHQTWAPVPGRFKDFVAIPRPNGYQSLHTSVVSDHGFPFEVQIRTERMHQVAEEGIAAHWKYKEGRVGAHPDEQYYRWLRQLLETEKDARDPSEFINSLKLDLYREEVYAFTAAGRGQGAAARQHAGRLRLRGPHRRRAHVRRRAVNGRMVPAAHAAPERRTSSRWSPRQGRTPSRDWLNFVATSRARHKIRHFIHGEEKVRAVELGRKLLDREIRRFELNPRTVLAPAELGRVAPSSASRRPTTLCASVGYGKLSARHVLSRLAPADDLEERTNGHPPEAVPERVSTVVRRRRRDQGQRLRRPARVSRRVLQPDPRRADRGLRHAGKGVSVHASTCPNVVNLLYHPSAALMSPGTRRADAPGAFTVRLTIQVRDRRGVLADVTTRIAEKNTNIRRVEADANEPQRGRDQRHHGRRRPQAPAAGHQGRAGRAGGDRRRAGPAPALGPTARDRVTRPS